MARTYVEKPRKAQADQFLIAVPPVPPGVSAVGDGLYVYEFPSGATVPIADTDWIVVDLRSGSTEVLTNAAFDDRYGSGPVLEGEPRGEGP